VTLKVRTVGNDVSGEMELFGKKLNAAQLAIDYYPWITMASVPFMALGPLVTLRKRMRYGYGEQIIACMLIMAGASVIGTVGTPLEWAAKGTRAAAAATAFVEGAKWLYQVWAYAQLQKDPKHVRGRFSRWALAVASFAASIAAIVVIFVAIVAVVVVAAVVTKKYVLHGA
jgi:hypothetical protein